MVSGMAESAGALSAVTLARIFGITDRHIRRLAVDGWLPKNPDGSFPLIEAVQGYIRYLKDENRRSSKSAASSKKDDARTREIELRIAERERNLVAVDTVQASFDAVWGAFRSEVDGLPARMRRNKALREEIQKLLDGILTRASGRIRETMRALRTGSADSPAVAEDDT